MYNPRASLQRRSNGPGVHGPVRFAVSAFAFCVGIGPASGQIPNVPTLERVSVSSEGGEANGHSYEPAISPSGPLVGRFVVFDSEADNLVGADNNALRDVFVRDRAAPGTTTRIEARTTFPARPSISADGQVVVFQSDADDLVAGDANGEIDIFAHDALDW